jgi:hypothetical protein
MTIEEIAQLLGLSGRDHKVLQMLAEFGFNKPLVPLPRGDKRIWRDEPFGFAVRLEDSHGVAFYFSYAEDLPAEYRKKYLEGEPVFRHATFYPMDGQYLNELPFGLEPTDTRQGFRQKLGEPSSVSGNKDYWLRDKYRFNAKFGQDGALDFVQVALPINE